MAKAVQPGLVVDQGIPFPSLKGGSIPLEAGLRVFQDFKPCDPPGKGPVNLCSSEKNMHGRERRLRSEDLQELDRELSKLSRTSLMLLPRERLIWET